MYRRVILQILPKCHFWNSKVCFSHVRLKENFHKNLEVVRNNNEAQKFCGILINAEEVIKEPECLYPPVAVFLDKNELHTHSIICELKEFIHKDKPEYTFIDTILKLLRNTSNETRQQLISLLFSIHTFDFFNQKSSKQFLKGFINDVECLLKSADKDGDRYSTVVTINGIRIYDSQGYFKKIQARLFSRSEKDVINLMCTVHKAIFDEGHHSDDQHAEIESLMSDTATLISARLLQLNSASKSVIEKCLETRNIILANDNCESTVEWFYLFGCCYFILDEVPFYFMTKKERLLQYLKDTKSSNNAWEFIESLKSIKGLNSDTDSDDKSLKSDLIMNRFKDIIHSEKPEYHIKKFILMPLQIRTPQLKEISELLSRFFLDVENFDCQKQNSEKYLTHFIQEFQHLISLYDNNLCGFRSSLERMFFKWREIRNSCTADLLEAILRKYHLHFFDEEKKKIGFLLAEAITPIQKYFENFLAPTLSASPLLQRSAFQYFKDFFDSFPIDENPLKFCDKSKIELYIQELDKDIESMCNDPESYADQEDEDCYIFDIDDSEDYYSDYADLYDLYENVASTFPESHVWWVKCSETLNKKRIYKFLNQLCFSNFDAFN